MKEVEKKEPLPSSSQDNPESSSSSSQTRENQYIGHYQEAPTYMKDNIAITHGYRINFNNPKKIIKSLFMVHNESVNIWTHLCSAIFILLLILYLLTLSFSSSVEFKITDNSSDALMNLTKIGSLKEPLTTEEDTHNPLLESYSEFSESMTNWRNQVNQQMEKYQVKMKEGLNTKIEEFDQLKKNFQTVFVPYVLDKINHKIDSTYMEQLKKKLTFMKTQIDSEAFNFVEVGHEKTPNPHDISRWPIVVFLTSAFLCLLCSTFFHLFYPMSGKTYQLLNRLDYAGVNLLMAGSSFPPLYYSLYCNFQVAIFYLVIICIGAFCLFFISFFEWIHQPERANLKAAMYGGFGISLSIPLGHITINQVVYNNYGDAYQLTTSIPYYILLGASYLFGLYVYTVRCPERKRPGKFNVCGHSHQIWHCFVVFGIIFTYIAVLQNFQMRKNCECPKIS